MRPAGKDLNKIVKPAQFLPAMDGKTRNRRGTRLMAARGSFMPIEHRPSVLAFDVYGTLIDPFQMEDSLRAFFGGRAKEATELWRSKQLEYSFRRALMKKYESFDVCTAEALRFVSRQFDAPLDEETLRNLLEQ